MKNLIVIDGKNMLYRFGYAHKYLEDSSGRPTGVLFGLAGDLLRLKNKYAPCKFVVVWDGERTYTHGWRIAHFPEYKQNRINASFDPALKQRILSQWKDVKDLLRVLSVPQVEIAHLEADDAIAMLASLAIFNDYSPIIVSSDKDFIQLMPQGCRLARSTTGKEFEDEDSVFDKFKCQAKDILRVRAVTGDPSDGIPSVYPGIGVVRAAKLVAGGLNPALAFDEQPLAIRQGHQWLKPKWDVVRRNYKIMTLIKDLKDDRLTDKQKTQFKNQAKATFSHQPHINYDEMLEFFGSFELGEALANRRELFELHA